MPLVAARVPAGRQRSLMVSLLGWLCAVAGCSADAVPVGSYCGGGGDCGGDLKCLDGYCRPQSCGGGGCSFYTESCEASAPQSCEEVGARGCLAGEEAEGVCVVGCPTDGAKCPDPEEGTAVPVCVDDETGVSVCALSCTQTAECPAMLECREWQSEMASYSICLPSAA